MKKKNIKILFSMFIFCVLINIPNASFETENCHQIKSSEEVDTNITMEDVNNNLTFRISSSLDVIAFRLSYIVNHTNGSSFYDTLGGMGDIYGGETFPLPNALRIWSISKNDLLFYHNGGILYNFWMDIYFINPIAEDIFYAGQITPDPFLQEDDDSDNNDDDGGDDTNNTDESDEMSLWVWIILGVIIVGSGVYGFFLPKKKVDQSRSNKENFSSENINPQSAEALERRRMRVRTNRNTRNNH